MFVDREPNPEFIFGVTAAALLVYGAIKGAIVLRRTGQSPRELLVALVIGAVLSASLIYGGLAR